MPAAILGGRGYIVSSKVRLLMSIGGGGGELKRCIDGSVNSVAGCVVKMKLMLCISCGFVFGAAQNAIGENIFGKCKASKF